MLVVCKKYMVHASIVLVPIYSMPVLQFVIVPIYSMFIWTFFNLNLYGLRISGGTC
jgi:hypothetical protein